MYEGAIIGEVDPRTTTREAIGLMMAGVRGGPQDLPRQRRLPRRAHDDAQTGPTTVHDGPER